jgi:uncharacterized membrane protein YgcG
MARMRMPARTGLALVAALATLVAPLHAQQPEQPKPLAVSPDLVSGQPKGAAGATFSKEQVEQLVAPIALYPDALVAQVLMASTYPLEVVQAARWSKANPKVTGKALEDAMQKQSWDPSVKSLTATPQVLAMMNEKLDWTQQLGDAFLASEKDVLDGVQRLRKKALDAGNLKTGKEQTVTTEQEGSTTIIKIEPANPTVVYVPVYDPMVIYGPWPYPAYPPYYWYPPTYAGGVFFAFSVGIIIGSAWWGGCHWGGGGGVYINHNVYNNFNRTNINNDRWEHRPEHRKGVEYRDQASRDKFGGQRPGVDTREAYRGRTEQVQRDLAGARDRPGTADRQRDVGGAGDRSLPGASDRAGGRQPGAFDGVGNGAQARDFSNRGASSRASAASRGFGGGQMGGARMGGGGRRR